VVRGGIGRGSRGYLLPKASSNGGVGDSHDEVKAYADKGGNHHQGWREGLKL